MAKVTEEMQRDLDREFRTGLVFGFLGGVIAIVLVLGGHAWWTDHKERERAKERRAELIEQRYRELESTRYEESLIERDLQRRFNTACYDSRGWVSADGDSCLSRGGNRLLFFKYEGAWK